MGSDDIGWGPDLTEADTSTVDLSLDGIPKDWSSWTRAGKVQKLVDTLQFYLEKVRRGSFNPKYGEALAALALEAQIELSDFYADAESRAKDAKHLVEFSESEVAIKVAQKASDDDIKVTEASIKRAASVSDEVKEAKKKLVELEREYKKWRYVQETVREAHIFFRNIGRL